VAPRMAAPGEIMVYAAKVPKQHVKATHTDLVMMAQMDDVGLFSGELKSGGRARFFFQSGGSAIRVADERGARRGTRMPP